MFDRENLDSALDDLELSLERVNLRYQRFYSGSERTEPAVLREEIERQLAELLAERANIGARARVRLTLIHRRYADYQESWRCLANRASEGPQHPAPPRESRAESKQAPVTPSNEPALRRIRQESSRTIRDFRQPLAREHATLEAKPPRSFAAGHDSQRCRATAPTPQATAAHRPVPDERSTLDEQGAAPRTPSLERARS